MAASWLFLSVKILDMAVAMRILKKKGAWFLEFPTPMDVTMETRLTPLAFMASMTATVPSVHIVSPTSLVFPPRAMTTPSISPASNTFATSAAFVTSPPITVRLSSVNAFPALLPPDPSGIFRFDGLRVRPITLFPSFRAWYTHSDAVNPEAPNTAMVFMQRDDDDDHLVVVGGASRLCAAEEVPMKLVVNALDEIIVLVDAISSMGRMEESCIMVAGLLVCDGGRDWRAMYS